MVWQDIALVGVNLIFVVSNIPQIIRGFKDKKKYIVLQMSIIVTTALAIQTFVFFTLGLKFTSIISTLLTISWAMLLYQSIFYKKNGPNQNDNSQLNSINKSNTKSNNLS